MKSSAIVLLLAVSAIALSSGVTPAFASKMDGKCCQSSDGGRSWRYKKAMHDGARIPRTCSAYAATCFHYATEFSYGLEVCHAAQAQCMRTGAYTGPYSGWHFTRMQRM
jgi:hypothetical protein